MRARLRRRTLWVQPEEVWIMLKDFRYEVRTETATRRLVTLTADDKPKLVVATPPEFRGGIAGVWSPEDLLVASVATCYALTLSAIAERRDVPLQGFSVVGAGHVLRRADGEFGFAVIELAVELTVDAAYEQAARRAGRAAESACIVANALRIPVEVELDVHAVRPVPAAVPVSA
jgi:organic hydroperoxide reductase OsmC/OhrA